MRAYSGKLGPTFLFWISQLHDKLAFMAEAHGRKALYCTRAGKRIEDLMNAYIGDQDAPFDSELFGISRIAACKAGAPVDETFVTAHSITAETLQNVTLGELCKAYMRHEWDESNPQMAALGRLQQPYDIGSFRSLIAANDAVSVFFRNRLMETREGLGNWLKENLKTTGDRYDNKGYVLVDSGWKGSIQRMLAEIYPDYGFEGLYFGVMADTPLDGRYGIVFDAATYDPDQPETAFILHRHLIETILEPNAPSVEDVLDGPNDATARAQLKAVADEKPAIDDDALFLGIRDYIAAHAHLSPDQILTQYRATLPDLVKMLATPSYSDATALGGKRRSIDFGRNGDVPVLIEPDEDSSPDLRIQHALWPQGQIALEYDVAQAKQLQMRVSGMTGKGGYFASHERQTRSAAAAEAANGKPESWEGSVAVVTRTKNRPLLFKRAALSVARQTWENYQWVVVNDGGDAAPVREIILNSGVDPTRITLVNNPSSVGMEAASNMGVRAVDTEFVVIHDDDDQWEPEFLRESVEFLQSPRAAAADFEGVLSRAWRVSEQIKGNEVIIHDSEPFMPWVSEVSMAQMAVGNFFAPISFLYRRWVYDKVGGYDERLPVLGDWRFNLDFLMQANIGFMDKYLSHYHHRDKGDSGRDGVYSNSVLGGQNLHHQYSAYVINGLLRDPKTPDGLRLMIANAHQQKVLEQKLDWVKVQVTEIQQQMDAKMGVSWNNQMEMMRHILPKSGDSALPQADINHIRASLRRARPYSPHPRRFLSRLRWDIRMLFFNNEDKRRKYLPQILHLIESPADFDHLTYLQKHPEIWATDFNGGGDLKPYHHYIMEGAEKGYDRPTL